MKLFELLFARDTGEKEWKSFKEILVRKSKNEGFDLLSHWALQDEPQCLGEVSVRMTALYYDYKFLKILSENETKHEA